MKDNYIHRREKEDNFFARLQKETLEELQSLSGEVWTDYNTHDPGITIAEILHYALYELQYQLQQPFETYLSTEGYIDFQKLGLLPKETLIQPSIVTAKDYEELIKQNIREVLNAKIALNEFRKYEITVELTEDAEVEKVLKEVEQLYHTHRNLCETLEKVVAGKIEKKNRKFKASRNVPEFDAGTKTFDIPKDFPPGYFSIQDHFPDNYGVNEKGMPAGITTEHKAKIMQLKAYLLIYDHLLANTLHQSVHAAKLLELSEETIPPYKPDFSISKMDELTDMDRFKDNKLQDKGFLDLQKSHLLDFLDVIYGEDTRLFSLHEDDITEQNKKRIALIPQLPQWNADRMRSFNILQEKINDDLPIQQLIKTILGYDIKEEEISVVELLAKYNLRLISDDELLKNYDNLDTRYIIEYLESNSFEYQIEKIPDHHLFFEEGTFEKLEKNLSFFWYNILFESLLQHGVSLDNFRIVNNPESNTYLLIFIIPGNEKWIYLGFSADKSLLIHLANQLQSFLKMLNRQTKPIYLVEHILLDIDNDEYDKLTIVIPQQKEKKWDQEKYEILIRERLPAYIETHIIWMSFEQFYHFEKNYFLWRKALADRDHDNIRKYAEILYHSDIKYYADYGENKTLDTQK